VPQERLLNCKMCARAVACVEIDIIADNNDNAPARHTSQKRERFRGVEPEKFLQKLGMNAKVLLSG